jgi:hypothetical protein
VPPPAPEITSPIRNHLHSPAVKKVSPPLKKADNQFSRQPSSNHPATKIFNTQTFRVASAAVHNET